MDFKDGIHVQLEHDPNIMFFYIDPKNIKYFYVLK